MQLVVIDIDGVLVGTSDTISPLTRRALARLRNDGIPCVLATGRPVASALAMARAVQAPYVVALGGAAALRVADAAPIWTADGIPPDVIAELWHSGQRLHAHTLTGWHATPHDEATRLHGQRHGLGPVSVGPPSRPILLLEVVDPLAGWACPPGLTVTTASDAHHNYQDLTPDGVDKASGLTHVLAALDVSWVGVVAMGDESNDVPVFKRAGLSVAVGTVPPADLLAHATHHVAMRADDGAVGAALLVLIYRDRKHRTHVQDLVGA